MELNGQSIPAGCGRRARVVCVMLVGAAISSMVAGCAFIPDSVKKHIPDGIFPFGTPAPTPTPTRSPSPTSPTQDPTPSPSAEPEKTKLTLRERQNRTFVTNATGSHALRAGFRYPRMDARMQDGDDIKLYSASHKTWISVAPQKVSTLRGKVHFISMSTLRHCGLDAASAGIRCNFGAEDSNVQLELKDAGWGGRFGLLAGGKLCSDRPEGIRCNIESIPAKINGWEAFKLVDAGQGSANLVGDRGKICSMQSSGIVCDDSQDAQGSQQLFRVATADESLKSLVLQQTSEEGAAAIFKVNRTGGYASTKVSLLCVGHSAYISIHPDSKRVGCFSTTAVEFDYRRLDGQTWWNVEKGGFQDSTSGKYFRAEGAQWGDHIDVKGDAAAGWSLFKIQLVGGYETVYPMVRGVNLGSWFLIERWMVKALFTDDHGNNLPEGCTAIDERGLMEELSSSVRNERMESHWNSWINESDIAWMAKHGLNTVRVPFGYWITHPEAPFVSGAFKYLVKLFEWCEKHAISVILDFHGLKGSQNGHFTSGNCGACKREGCGTTWVNFLQHQDTNLAVIANLSKHFAQSPSYLGFGIANEVGGDDVLDSRKVMAFYQKAYDTIRKHTADTLVIFDATFNPSSFPFVGEQHIALDDHIYYSARFKDGASAHSDINYQLAQKKLQEVIRWPVLVGEWALDHHGYDLKGVTDEDKDKWHREFARAQLQAYEQHSMGWTYWSYKTDWHASTWNYRHLCEEGVLPGCTSSLQYSSDDWWGRSLCHYAYLDGRKCDA